MCLCKYDLAHTLSDIARDPMHTLCVSVSLAGSKMSNNATDLKHILVQALLLLDPEHKILDNATDLKRFYAGISFARSRI